MKPIDRTKFYKKPKIYGAQTLYNSKILSDISLEHWKNFNQAVKSINGLKVGDSIDVAVNTTAIQLVRFLDEFANCKSIDDVKSKANAYINEIQMEVSLDTNSTLKSCQAGNDGHCSNLNCPQYNDNEPQNTGRSCPLPHWSDDVD